jgi:hypothetical protein
VPEARTTTGKSKARAGAGAFVSNLVPALTLFFIGYPLGRGTIRATLVGWFLILVAMTQFILSRWFHREGSAVAVLGVTARSSDSRHYR